MMQRIMMRRIPCVAMVLLFVLAAGRSAAADLPLDDFQDGTTAGWTESAYGWSPNPPTNIADGGPDGDGDRYLENVSSGSGQAGSRMMMFNAEQWAFDYAEPNVVRITADMRNSGANDLAMRIAIGNGNILYPQTAVTWYASTLPFTLAADSQWHRSISFDLTEDALTHVGGALQSLENVLASVSAVRILSASALGFQGDRIAATLGVDNITALAEELLVGDMDRNGRVNLNDIDDFVLGLNDPAAYEQTHGMVPTQIGDTDGDNDLDFDDIPGFVELFGPGFMLGDMNYDQRVNDLDVDPFVDVLLNGPFRLAADINQDGNLNGRDVDGFVVLLQGPGQIKGDMNGDRVVDGLDVAPFIDVLLQGPFQAVADMNDDGRVNGLDIDPFTSAVGEGDGLHAVPEPAAAILAALGLWALAAGWRPARKSSA